MAAPPVDECGTDRPDQGERDEEDPRVHRRLDPDVTDPAGAVAEIAGFGPMPAEQLDEQGTRDVEPLRHGVVHRRVEVHALPRDGAESRADAPGREDENREDHNRQQRQLPLQQEHGDERAAERDDVADDGAERAGERPLRADHVVVEPTDERAGLGAGEERNRHPLYVIEQLHSKVVDQALADPAREVALDQAQNRFAQRSGDHKEEEDVEVAAVPIDDGVIENLADQQGRQQSQEGRRNDRAEEADDGPAIGPSEGEDPPPSLLGELFAIEGGTIRCHRVHDHERAGSIHRMLQRIDAPTIPMVGQRWTARTDRGAGKGRR